MRQGRRLLRGARPMSRILVVAIALCGAVAHAEVYRCPPAYPGRDAPALPLTGAFVMWGERPTSGPPFPDGWLRGDDRPAEDGVDVDYELPHEPEPKWLICEYGSRKRVKGRLQNGHEWGQYMEGYGKQVWFVKLAPTVSTCTVRTREVKARRPSTWTAMAVCESR